MTATHTQKLLFAKDKWNPVSIRLWVARQPAHRRYVATKIEDMRDDYHVRQRDPADFIAGSFRTIPLGKTTGIQAVIGHLKPEPAVVNMRAKHPLSDAGRRAGWGNGSAAAPWIKKVRQ